VQDIARLVNAAPGEDREELCEYTIGLLREEVQLVETELPSGPATDAATGKFNPLGIGIPVLLVGGVLIVVFPPVGLFLFGVAALLMVWGVVATLVARH
jgi:hypothetical protein